MSNRGEWVKWVLFLILKTAIHGPWIVVGPGVVVAYWCGYPLPFDDRSR